MAEVLALIGTIVGLATTGFDIARRVTQVAHDFRTASDQIRAVGIDTHAVSLSLYEMQRKFKAASNVRPEVCEVASEIVELCRTDIEGVDFFLRSLQPLVGREISVKQKTNWLFAKSKVATRRASLDSLKLTLTLFLHTWDFVANGEVDDIMQAEVQDRIREIPDRKTQFLRAKFTEALAEKADEDLSDEPESDWEEPSEHDTIVGAEPTLGALSLSDPALPPDRRLQLHNAEGQALAMLDDVQWMFIGDHLRVQRIASEFALVVIQNRGTIPTDMRLVTRKVPWSMAGPDTIQPINPPWHLLQRHKGVQAETVDIAFNRPKPFWFQLLMHDVTWPGHLHNELMKWTKRLNPPLTADDMDVLADRKYVLHTPDHGLFVPEMWPNAYRPGQKILVSRPEDTKVGEYTLGVANGLGAANLGINCSWTPGA